MRTEGRIPGISPAGFRLVLASAALSGACGAGVAGVVSGLDDHGGGRPPILTAFEVVTPKVSPTPLHIEASVPVRVELSWELDGTEKPMAHLSGPGVSGNAIDLPLGGAVEWDFGTELGDAGFTPDILLRARRADGSELSGGSLALGVGNDPPVVVSVDPRPTDPSHPEESSGNVEVSIVVKDSSSDVVTISVKWRRAGDPPEAWQLATGAGVFPGGVETNPGGVALSFFWNTAVDLEEGDDDVVLRVTADDRTLNADNDPIGVSMPALATLHVDNNEEPIVQLDSGPILANPDERRGIPLPYRILDDEGDLVEVIFQWRRPGEEFPELELADMAALDALLADPFARKEHHVCTAYSRSAQGLVLSGDATSARLPELAAGESWVVTPGLEGQTLELLRASSLPEPLGAQWASNPLESPVAALPLGDGLTALVLDAPGSARLREIELATGAIVREIAQFESGMPTAMAAEVAPGRGRFDTEAVLVALEQEGHWRIERVGLADGSRTEIAFSDGTQPAPVRGIASLGRHVAVFTAGSALWFTDYRNPLELRVTTLLTDLATPWGVVVDPKTKNRIWLAERDAVRADGTGRVVALDLDSRGSMPAVRSFEDLGYFDRPRSIALEDEGTRLLVVTSTSSGYDRIAGLDLGASSGPVMFSIGEPYSPELSDLSIGPAGMRLAALPLGDALLVGGGMEQRRALVGYDASFQRVSVASAFDPLPRPGQPWRIPAASRSRRASVAGVDETFVWDSSADLPGGGTAFLRAIPRDAEIGIGAASGLPKRVRSNLDVAPAMVGFSISAGSGAADERAGAFLEDQADTCATAALDSAGALDAAPSWIGRVLSGVASGRADETVGGHLPGETNAIADLDSDGDLDLVCSGGPFFEGSLQVYLQSSTGGFPYPPMELGGPPRFRTPTMVVAADLDSDGYVDLASSNLDSDNLGVFFQTAPGQFGRSLSLGGPGITNDPAALAAADFDGDGKLDLVSANDTGDDLTVFLWTAPDAPVVLQRSNMKGPRGVAVGDLDSDGDVDIVSANEESNNLTVFFQSTPGHFASSPRVLGGAQTTPYANSVAAADLDQDGDLDVACSSGEDSTVVVFFQNDPGRFSAPLVLGGRPKMWSPLSVVAADLDSDRDLDLVAPCWESQGVAFFFQSTPGHFDVEPLIVSYPRPTFVSTADLDTDGDSDLVVSGDSGNLPRLFHQTAPGAFEVEPLVLGGGFTTLNGQCVTAADVDSDGTLDIVSANQALTVFFQDAPGNFDPDPLVLAVPEPAESGIVADLDSDGDLDLASCQGGFDDSLTVFLQESPRDFAPPTDLFPGQSNDFRPYQLTAADLDSDGDLDLVTGNTLSNNLMIFRQTGDGSFDLTPQVLDGSAGPVVPCDLDADGDFDLICPGGPDGLMIFSQDKGTLTPSPLTVDGPPFSGVSTVARDFDGDGDLDLASADYFATELTVLFQAPSGTFVPGPPLDPPDGEFAIRTPRQLDAADLDSDGDLDLVSANTGVYGGSITAFFQETPGRFDPLPLTIHDLTFGGSEPAWVHAADLDGDGDCDLAVSYSRELRVFWGGR